MLNGIKNRLIHFETDGASIVSDFVSTRQKRAGMLRRVVHVCFYIQCAAALVCVVCGFAMGGAAVGAVLAVGAAASVGAALMAVSGDFAVRTVSYVLDLVYAVICFVVGGDLFTLCGALMLVAAAAALAGFAAGYFKSYLLEYSPVKLTRSDYTLTGNAVEQPVPTVQESRPVEPPPKPKSELLIIAEQVSKIMNAPRPSEQQNSPETPQNAFDDGRQSAEVVREAPTYADGTPIPPQDVAAIEQDETVGEAHEC